MAERIVEPYLGIPRGDHPGRSAGIYLVPFNLTVRTPNKVKFLFGDQQTDWARLSLANHVANHITRTPEIKINSSLLNGTTGFVKRMRTIRTSRSIDVLPSPLDLMHSFRLTNCSDPRDKVYAPLCLTPDDIRHKIPPDYVVKTASEVFSDVVRYHLARDASNLDFLGYVMHQERSSVLGISEGVVSALPSWVPNFSHKLNIGPISKTLHLPINLESRGLAAFDRRGWPNDKGAKQPSYCPLDVSLPAPYINGLALCISGVFFDFVKDIIPKPIPGKDQETAEIFARKKAQNWRSDMNNKYFTGDTFNDAYNWSLVLDLVFDYLNRAAGRGGKYDVQFQKEVPRGPQCGRDQTSTRNEGGTLDSNDKQTAGIQPKTLHSNSS